ncbi:MAG: amidohydrolase [Candidatus Marisimplicoccus sp.]
MRSYIFLFSIIFCSCSQNVDLIVHNAKIYTADKNFSVKSSLIVDNGIFIDIGGDDLMKKYSSRNIIDAQGLSIYPGFIDSHSHFYNLGFLKNQLDLTSTESLDDVINAVKKYDSEKNPDFIIGRGWDQNDWADKSFPTNIELNKNFPNKPVILRRIDGHAYLVNNAALELANISTSSKVEGGEFLKSRGRLTGVLIDNAMRLIDNIIPEPTTKESISALLAAQDACFENGLTTVSDAGISKKQIMLIDSLQKQGVLDIRIYAMIHNNQEDVDYFIENGPLKTPKLNVRSVKVYADGALGSRGASLINSYSDRRNHLGLMRTSPDSIRNLAFKLAGTRFQMNTHAIGDNANRIVLNAYKDALYNYRDPRWRIEHAQVIHPDDYKLFNPKIIPSVQPTHATSDMYWLYDRVGEKRGKHSYAWSDLYERSKTIAFGTDFPVEEINPIMTFYSAVFRKDLEGFPKEGFQLENSIGRADALMGMTYFGAHANFEEDEKGSIEIGKLADFVILDTDLINDIEYRVKIAKPVATFLDGKLVFSGRFN